MFGQKNSTQFTEKRFNKQQEDDCWDMLDKTPFLMICNDMFVSMVLKCAPTITLDTLGWEMTDELQFLFKTYWVPTLQQAYTWDHAVGYFPIRWKNVKGTHHRIPVIPPRGSGYGATMLNAENEQEFVWYWDKQSEPDKNVKMETWRHPPGTDGSIRSPLASLLYEWRTLTLVRRSTEIATDQQAHQQHIFEFHPAKTNNGDDNLASLEQFGDEIAGTVLAQQEGLNSRKSSMRIADLHQSLAMAQAYNRGMRRGGPILKSESRGDAWDRENANVLERGIPLKPDFNYKPVPPPRITTNLIDVSVRFEKMASAVMDIPYQLIESTGGRTAANVQGNLRFVNERLKDWTDHFETLVKKWFLIAYGKIVQEGLDARPRLSRNTDQPHQLLRLYADTEVDVSISCTPIATAADIAAVHMAGYMKKETAAKHTFNILGLAASDIHISDYPDRVPEPLAAKEPMKKRAKTDVVSAV